MLSHQPFYHKHVRTFVVLFGTIFNDISFQRFDSSGSLIKTIKVPLSYARKDKALINLKQNPELRNTFGPVLPRMAFYLQDLAYSPERKTSSMTYSVKDSTGTKKFLQHSPAPYDLTFELSIWVKYAEDGFQIVEQILPFFQPEYTVLATEVPDLDLKRDIHISLDSVSYDDSAEGSFDEERIIEWNLVFTLKAYFYGPIEEKSVIKDATATTYFMPDFTGNFSSTNFIVDPIDALESEPHTIIETKTEGFKE